MENDEALMLAFQRGSREAFDELFARYRQLLYGYFRRRLATRERAEDLTQETFLALLRATERYEPRALFRTYLFGIAIKLLAAEHRKSLRAEMPGDPVCDPPADEALWVRQALQRLEPIEREILMLREYEQLSYSEIAGLLRLPLNTVRTRLFRSRAALKDYLKPANNEA
jgi:RNA polymerase sigma-70 factor (ECF subfamily)